MSEPAQTVTFTGFVLSLAHTAAVHFGDVADPVTGRPRGPNLPARAADDRHPRAARREDARQPDAEERQLLEQVLYELRLRFVEAQQASRTTGRASSQP